MDLRPTQLHLRETDSAIVPLPPLELPEEIEALGEIWLRKPEFHVTAAHVDTLTRFVCEGTGASEDEAREPVLATLRRAAWEHEIGAIATRDELRVVREGEERTIVVMVDAPGVGRLHRRLGEQLGVELSPPPAHITIYTGPEERGGIGLHTADDLGRLTEEIAGAEGERLRAAIGPALFT